MLDLSRDNIEQCETMARLVCDANLLKASDTRLKGATISSKFCVRCDLGIQESIKHIVMQCPSFEEDRAVMPNELNETNNVEIKNLLSRSDEVYLFLMGKHPEEYSFEVMYVFWTISARHITAMYKKAIAGR